jgi:ADP-heptose:LPS heptosyltransferase
VPSGAIHLSINAGNALKEWPVEHWAALVKELSAMAPRLQFVVTGTSNPRERERLERFSKLLQAERVQIYPGNLTLAQLAALLERCRLHVGADSGALHLATILGVKTVSLFREYAGLEEWLPRGANHRYVAVPCGCVNQKVQPCATQARPACLAAISVAQVLALIQELGPLE